MSNNIPLTECVKPFCLKCDDRGIVGNEFVVYTSEMSYCKYCTIFEAYKNGWINSVVGLDAEDYWELSRSLLPPDGFIWKDGD